jgi:hypothetical protein
LAGTVRGFTRNRLGANDHIIEFIQFGYSDVQQGFTRAFGGFRTHAVHLRRLTWNVEVVNDVHIM